MGYKANHIDPNNRQDRRNQCQTLVGKVHPIRDDDPSTKTSTYEMVINKKGNYLEMLEAFIKVMPLLEMVVINRNDEKRYRKKIQRQWQEMEYKIHPPHFEPKKKQDGRLALAYFAHSHICIGSFKKMRTFYFSKKHSFFIIFSNFSNVQSFLIFCQENLIIRSEKIFSSNNNIWYAF